MTPRSTSHLQKGHRFTCMLFVILIVVFALLLAVLASAIPTPTRRTASSRLDQRQKPSALGSQTAPPNQPESDSLLDNVVGLGAGIPSVDAWADEFIPVRKTAPTPIDRMTFEGLFVSANGPFTRGRRNDDDVSMCFVTGQTKAVCECDQCRRRRESRGL